MLEDLYLVASIIAAFAVVGSLLFVGLQIKANTRENDLTRRLEGADNYQVFQLLIIENPEFREIWLKGRHDISNLSPSELLCYGAYLAMWVDAIYRYKTRREAGYDVFDWEVMKARFKPITNERGAHQWWEKARNGYEDEIRDIVDNLLKEAQFAAHP